MDLIASFIKYSVYSFIGGIALLFLLALVFGKRVKKKWEYEADFHDENNYEIGEFDIELSKYEKENTDFQLKAKFHLRHPELIVGSLVQVFLNNELVMEGSVEAKGRIYLSNTHLKSDLSDPQEGQICKVICSGLELFAVPIHKD